MTPRPVHSKLIGGSNITSFFVNSIGGCGTAVFRVTRLINGSPAIVSCPETLSPRARSRLLRTCFNYLHSTQYYDNIMVNSVNTFGDSCTVITLLLVSEFELSSKKKNTILKFSELSPKFYTTICLHSVRTFIMI